MTHPRLDPITTEYLLLGLTIERAFPGFVDAYHGDPALKAEVNAAPVPEPAALLERARAFEASLEGADIEPERIAFLRAQARAMTTMTRLLAGESMPYTEEVASLFDIDPAWTPESTFDAAIADLDQLLPGSGDVRERMVAWRDRTVVTPEVAREMIDRISTETRARTARLIELPEGDEVEFRMVTNQPWSGYNWFLGNGKSRVEINTDLPIRASGLLDLIAHEAHPGHHTEHSLKEQRLYHGQGWGEYAIQLINTPECVISEGIATLAAGFIFEEGEGAAWMAGHIYPMADLPADPERETGIARAGAALRAVGANAALMLHDRGASEEEVIAYFMKYGLDDETRARHRLSFIADPLWRAYIFCYHAGRDLLAGWLDQSANQSEREDRIRRLMLEPITPGGVRN
ncbi:MAG: hypothetical protein IT334_08260 [Thermomicrobiales bacterium]|nr:hypothetical protein [Thermomicrobiales bacterium]